MLECDDFSISSNMLSMRPAAETVGYGVRCAALTFHKADWPVAVLSRSRAKHTAVVVVVVRYYNRLSSGRPKLTVNTIHKPKQVIICVDAHVMNGRRM